VSSFSELEVVQKEKSLRAGLRILNGYAEAKRKVENLNLSCNRRVQNSLEAVVLFKKKDHPFFVFRAVAVPCLIPSARGYAVAGCSRCAVNRLGGCLSCLTPRVGSSF
jgi:hypothetical protein